MAALAEVRTALKNLRAHFVGRQGMSTVLPRFSAAMVLPMRIAKFHLAGWGHCIVSGTLRILTPHLRALSDDEQGDMRPYAKFILNSVKGNKDAADSESHLKVSKMSVDAFAAESRLRSATRYPAEETRQACVCMLSRLRAEDHGICMLVTALWSAVCSMACIHGVQTSCIGKDAH